MAYDIIKEAKAIKNDWNEVIAGEINKDYFKKLANYVMDCAAKHCVYPPSSDVFNAFKMTALKDLKVVIIGQDPYHGEDQANGLAFSVGPFVRIPPSLRNIYKEIYDNYPSSKPPTHGDLTSWAKQGVLLLNATLTVEAQKAGSHQKVGWEDFTDFIVSYINEHCQNIVFILWGSFAQKKGASIDQDRHLVLKAHHPSPLAAYRGFFGCQHFLKANEFLKSISKEPIIWLP